VLNAQAVEFARDKGIVIHARSTFQSGPGTKIVPCGKRELRISGVAQEKDLLVVRAEDGAAAIEALRAHAAWPRELWCEGAAARLAVVPLENVHGLAALVAALRDVEAHVEEGLAQVSIVGSGIGASHEPLRRATAAIAIAPRASFISPLRISMLVPREASDECVRRLHAEFVERS
jgi:aspartate kinase